MHNHNETRYPKPRLLFWNTTWNKFFVHFETDINVFRCNYSPDMEGPNFRKALSKLASTWVLAQNIYCERSAFSMCLSMDTHAPNVLTIRFPICSQYCTLHCILSSHSYSQIKPKAPKLLISCSFTPPLSTIFNWLLTTVWPHQYDTHLYDILDITTQFCETEFFSSKLPLLYNYDTR